jgi:sugar lactone lactonase YvrE
VDTRSWLVVVVLAMIAYGCSDGTFNGLGSDIVASPSSAAPETGGAIACDDPSGDVPWTSDVSAKAVVLAEGSGSTPRVEAVVYPHPDYDGNPWSQWGQGLLRSDGRYFSAIGDHRGPDGNAYLFEYSPATKTLTQIVDVLGIVDHTPGDWGFGKVHAQMVRGPCNNILVTTYWGTRRGIEFTDGYQGDVLISLDPEARTVGSLGVVYPGHGVPSLAASPDGRLLYAEAVDPLQDGDMGAFVVRDALDGTTIFVDSDEAHIGYRSIAVDADGRALYSIGQGRLAVYDPQTNTRSQIEGRLPGEWLRAATEPDTEGVVYGVTRDPEVFFALTPDGAVRTLSEALGYTTSVALSPDGATVYSVPEAHGQSWRLGAPLIAMDTATGDQRTVIELQPLADEQLGLRLGGTYNVAVDRSGKTVYLGMNASQIDDDSGFGEVVLIIVTLP